MDWALQIGVDYSDNIRRTPDQKESETAALAGLQLALATDRPRLDADIAVDLQYRDYLDQVYESEIVGGANAFASYTFAPDRFLWVAQDNYGQISNLRVLPDTPDNRRDFNYFTTGPDFTVPLGARTQIVLSGRWSDAYFEEDDTGISAELDSNTTLGMVGLVRQFSETASLSLNASVSETRFDEDLADSYEIQEGFMRYEASGLRTSLALDAGYTTLKQGEVTSDGPLARLELIRRVASRSQIILQAGTEYSTTADTFRRDQAVGGVDLGTGLAVASSDAYQTDYIYLGWNTEWPRTSLAVDLNARREEHEFLTLLDREQLAATLSWTRRLSQVLDLNLRGIWLDETLLESNVTFDEWSVGAALSWALNQRVTLAIGADRYEGSGEGFRTYTENRAYLMLSYGDAR